MRILLAATAALLLAGCSQPGADQPTRLTPLQPVTPESPTASAAPTTTVTTSMTLTAAPDLDTPMPAVTAWVAAGTAADPDGFHTATRDGVTTELGEFVAFTTPSGDTQCMTDDRSDGQLACLVTLDDPAPRPAEGSGEWVPGWVDFDGSSLEVGALRADPAQFSVGTGTRLPHGKSLKFANYQCRSDTNGLICVNFAHQTAVRLSSSGVETFGCLREVTAPSGIGSRFACE